jgi:type III restriction enzyme
MNKTDLIQKVKALEGLTQDERAYLINLVNTVQTMGRILRMPQQKHYANEALNYGYVYTNLNKDLITILPEEADYITENSANRNNEIYQAVALKSYYIQKEINRNRIGLHFREALFRAAEQLF